MKQTSAYRAATVSGKVFALLLAALFVTFDVAGVDKPLVTAAIYAAMPATLVFNFSFLIFEIG